MADGLGQAVLTLTVDDKQFNAGLDRAKQKTDQTLGSIKAPGLGGVFGAIKGGLVAAGLAATALSAAVIGIGYAATQSAGQVQRLTAAFTGLTGSAEAAAQLRQSLFDLSKTTPFKNEEILTAAQRFLAVGVSVEALNGTINRVGALAAQSGQSLDRLALIYAQVYAKGRLQGEENLQLLEAGVDLTQELSQVTGLSGKALQDAMSKGQIGIDKFNQALLLATGDMTALQLAGKAVDVQFNNIFDNLGQLFGGFASAIAPALSAAFRVINDIFDSAFPDLESITDFFAPLTTEAERFAKVLGESPGVIEVIAGGLKNMGEVVIQNIADGLSMVNDILQGIDQQKFIEGFILAEVAVRRVFLAASALGAQLVKNAELSFRAISNPLKFGQGIVEAGGFGKFIEKEYALVERKWNDWASSEPLGFPDLTGKAEQQTDQIAGNLDSKLNATAADEAKLQKAREEAAAIGKQNALFAIQLEQRQRQIAYAQQLGSVEEGAYRNALQRTQEIQESILQGRDRIRELGAAIDEARMTGVDPDSAGFQQLVNEQRLAAEDVKLKLVEGATALRDAGVQLRKDLDAGIREFTKVRSDPNGLNRYLSPELQGQRAQQDFQLLLPQFRQAQAEFFNLTGQRAPEFSGATASVNASIRDFIQSVTREGSAGQTVVDAQRAVATTTQALADVNGQLLGKFDALIGKNWAVQVNVAADGTSAAYGDVLAGAIS